MLFEQGAIEVYVIHVSHKKQTLTFYKIHCYLHYGHVNGTIASRTAACF